MTTPISDRRNDIDALRAFAVIAVVIYHLNPNLLPGGFAGVDIFFVISGYVVTQSLDRLRDNLPNSGVLLSEFYFRRARRILPAVLCTAFFSFLLSSILIPYAQLRDILISALTGIIGISNVFLLKLSDDYFGPGLEANPFTHLWSLGVEEQFYLLFPILFLLNKQRLLIFLLIVSFYFSYTFSISNSEIAFFLSPLRFWELCVGALASKFNPFDRFKFTPYLHIGSFALLIIGTFFISPNKFPLPDNLLVVIPTLIFLITNTPKFTYSAATSYIGRISFSIYLWHWPLIVLADWTIGKEKIIVQILIVIFTLGLASLQYRFLEHPLNQINRNTRSITKIFIMLIFTSLSLIIVYKVIGFISKDHNNAIAFQSGIEIVTYGKHEAQNTCNPQVFGSDKRIDLERCLKRTVEETNIFILGDSHGQQIKETFVSAFEKASIRQIHFGTISNILNGNNAEDFDYTLSQVEEGDFVVLKFFRLKFFETGIWHVRLGNDPITMPGVSKKMQNLENYLKRFSQALHSKNVKLLLVLDTPQLSQPKRLHSCVFQDQIFGTNNCDVHTSQSLHTRAPMDVVFSKISKLPNVWVWDPHPLICNNEKCPYRIDDQFIMSDHNHITTQTARGLSGHLLTFLENTSFFAN